MSKLVLVYSVLTGKPTFLKAQAVFVEEKNRNKK